MEVLQGLISSPPSSSDLPSLVPLIYSLLPDNSELVVHHLESFLAWPSNARYHVITLLHLLADNAIFKPCQKLLEPMIYRIVSSVYPKHEKMEYGKKSMMKVILEKWKMSGIFSKASMHNAIKYIDGLKEMQLEDKAEETQEEIIVEETVVKKVEKEKLVRERMYSVSVSKGDDAANKEALKFMEAERRNQKILREETYFVNIGLLVK